MNLMLKAEKNTETKNDIILCISYAVLILGGMLFKPLVAAAMVFIALSFFFISEERIFAQLLFLTSFACIFKFSASGTSVFTMIEIYVVLLLLYKRKKVNVKKFFAILIAVLYALVLGYLNATLDLKVLVKYAVGIALISIATTIDWKANINKLLGFYAGGLIVSSVFALFDNIFPFATYIRFDNLFIGNEIHYDIERFSGLNSDPNFYVIGIVLSGVGILTFMINNKFKNKALPFLTLILLIPFGVITYSKSFLLMVAFVSAYVVVTLINKSEWKALLVILICLIIFAVLIFSGKIPALNLNLERILKFDNLNDFTTNRFKIWGKYFGEFKSNWLLSLFGKGVGTYLRGASHNTYIDMLYNLGVVGIIIFAIALVLIFEDTGRVKRVAENYFAIVAILVMYFFLSSFTWHDTPFQIILAYYLLNTNLSPNEEFDNESAEVTNNVKAL